MTKRSDEIAPSLIQAVAGKLTEAELRAVLDTSLLSVGRLKGLIAALNDIKGLSGDTAEIGTAHGGTSRLIASLSGNRRHWACDTFTGLVDCGEHDNLTNGQFHNPQEKVRASIGNLPNVRMVAGYFPKSASNTMARHRFALVHIDVDTYKSIHACFAWFVPRMVPGGFIVLDDVLERGCQGAIKAFEEITKTNRDKRWSVFSTAPPQCVVRFA